MEILTILRHGLRELTFFEMYGGQIKATAIIFIAFGAVFVAADLLDKATRRQSK